NGRLYRIVTNGFSRHEIWIPRQTHAVSGIYSVMPTGGKAWPTATRELAFRWYGGATDPQYTHYPQNAIYESTIGTVARPTWAVEWKEGAPPFGEMVSHDAVRSTPWGVFDLWSALDEEGSEADKCYTPEYFKAFFS